MRLIQTVASLALVTMLVSGCVNPINLSGNSIRRQKSLRFQSRTRKPKLRGASPPRATSIEGLAVKPGDEDYFTTDWDVPVSQKKAPPRGNALYSWTQFDKDIEALKKIKPTHYRFSIEWARVEPQPGVYNEEAIQGYVRMARKLKSIGVEPVVCL